MYCCPLAGEYNCVVTFNSEFAAQEHALSVHRGMRYPSPWQKRIIVRRRFPGEKNCHETCETAHLGINRWMCSVLRCKQAVRRQALSSRRMSRHMAKHQKSGHTFGGILICQSRSKTWPSQIQLSQRAPTWTKGCNRIGTPARDTSA
jgi:hypothetical protein